MRTRWSIPAALVLLLSLSVVPAGIHDLVVTETEHAFLGVTLGGHHRDGIRISGVVQDSGAQHAGMRQGDVIIEVDGEEVRNQQQLRRAIRAHHPGARISVTVLRDGSEEVLDAEVGVRRELKVRMDEPYHVIGPEMRGRVHGTWSTDNAEELADYYICEGDDCRGSEERIWYRMDCLDEGCPQYIVNYWGGRAVLGVHTIQTTAELREHLGSDGRTGVLISKVVENSPAESAGVLVGDLIVEVDGSPIRKDGDIRRALKPNVGETFEVVVVRDGRTVRLDAHLPALVAR